MVRITEMFCKFALPTCAVWLRALIKYYMKNKIYKILFICFLLQALFICNGMGTTIQLSGALIDTLYPNCPLPVFHEFEWWGNTTGYLPTDSISVHVYFGDGHDTIIKSLNYHANPQDFFLGSTTHTYTLSGTYTMKFVATGPDGNADSITHINYFTTSDTCATTNIKELATISQSVVVYPNPASTILNFHSNSQLSTLNSQLIITDLLGTEVYKEMLPSIDN
jgi:hypothetical protein